MGLVSSSDSSIGLGILGTSEDAEVYNELDRIGQKKYKAISQSDQLTLEFIYYCEIVNSKLVSSSTISDSGGQEGPSPISLANHHFVIIELKMEGGQSLYVAAEKVGYPPEPKPGAPPYKPGIYINWVDRNDMPTYLRKVCTDKIRCYAKKVRLNQIEDILEAPDPHYSLLNSNCIHYAVAVRDDLVRFCSS